MSDIDRLCFLVRHGDSLNRADSKLAVDLLRKQQDRIKEIEHRLSSVTTMMACSTCGRSERPRYMVGGLCVRCIADERDAANKRIAELQREAFEAARCTDQGLIEGQFKITYMYKTYEDYALSLLSKDAK